MSKFNDFPPHWREISNEEFARILFLYQTPETEYRQMRFRDVDGNLDYTRGYVTAKLFPIKDGFHNAELGIGLFQIYINSAIQQIGFAKYGSDEEWRRFESSFANQFRGDYS